MLLSNLFQSDILLEEYPIHETFIESYKIYPYEADILEEAPLPEVPILSDLSCMYCAKTFAQKRYLMDHLNTHTGKRPYVCKYCSKGFTQRASRNRHIKLCHKDIVT